MSKKLLAFFVQSFPLYELIFNFNHQRGKHNGRIKKLRIHLTVSLFPWLDSVAHVDTYLKPRDHFKWKIGWILWGHNIQGYKQLSNITQLSTSTISWDQLYLTDDFIFFRFLIICWETKLSVMVTFQVHFVISEIQVQGIVLSHD